ncbi:cytochrome P450 [Favolaschia claudopus]|uniref:Cytochrome P450 n=1 Tax=Favolaschia claudopus TaxID=2862362 RepID=A0AAW0CDY7_9AGAR
MPLSLSPTQLSTAAFLALGLYFLARISRRRSAPLPPGPRPWFGFTALPTSTDRAWAVYCGWAEKWGEITSVTAFGQTVVVLNSLKVAVQMIDKKSSKYDRPVFQMCGELIGWTQSMVMISTRTPQFRWTRKIFHQLAGSQGNVKRFHPLLNEEYRKFLQRLLETPEQFRAHINFITGAIALRITYGYTVRDETDPMLDLVNKVMDDFSQAIIPGAFLVDLLPILKYIPTWIPGAGFQRKAKLWAKRRSEMFSKPFELVKEQVAQGTAQDSFVSLLLEQDLSQDEQGYLQWAAGSIYGGAADTTASTISTFFLQMVLHPEIQAKAQAEIDAVVGNKRLPTYEDRERLPYVDALCKEVFRSHPVGPTGVPLCATEDDVHNGYFIPKGSLVLVNIWNMAHDPELYSNPMAFDPSRFIASEGHTPEPDPRGVVFGFGRRVCPGNVIADTSVFTACAMTLATFTISAAVQDGKVVQLTQDFLPGSISGPAPFSCTIKPRSPEVAALVA